MSNKIYVAESIAGTIIKAGIDFAKESIALTERTRERDKTNPLLAQERFSVRDQVMQNTIGAVVLSVAGVEATVNELLASYTNEKLFGPPSGNVALDGRKRLKALQQEGVFNRGQNALDKAQLILQVLDLSPLRKGANPVQDFAALISLRNALVHAEYKHRPYGSAFSIKERDALERKLSKRFSPNSLESVNSAFIWKRCLGSGCAKWSAETACQFTNSFFQALGISNTRKILWDSKKIDGDSCFPQ